MKRYSKYILIILIALIVGVGTNIAHPVTPYIIKESGWPEYSFSIFFSLMSLGMLIFAPVWGNISDKHSSKIVILFCSIGYSIGQVMFSLFNNLYLVCFARFFSGCFSCGLNVAILSYMAKSLGLKEFDKSRLIPTVLSFQLVGQAIGNFIGGILGDIIEYKMVLIFQAIFLSILGIIIFLFFSINDEEKLETTKRRGFISNLLNIRKIGIFSILFLICLALFSLVFTNVNKFLDYYFADLGKSSTELGSLNLIISGVTLLANLVITPFFLKRFKAIPSIIIFGILGFLSILITFIPSDTNVLFIFVYSVYMIYIISKAVIESASVSYISENKEVNPGLILGVRQSFLSLGAVIGPLLGGAIYYALEIEKRNILFFICAGIYLFSTIAILVLFMIKKRGSGEIENKGYNS